MDETKASDVVAVREILRAEKKDEQLLESLSPDNRRIFETALPTAWISDASEEEILTRAASVLFPRHPDPVWQLGSLVANKNLTGIYRMFLRIPSPAFIINRAPMLWSLVSKKGKLSVQMIQPRHCLVRMVEYPELPRYQIHYIAGYIEKITELVGIEQSEIKINDARADAWEWEVKWM